MQNNNQTTYNKTYSKILSYNYIHTCNGCLAEIVIRQNNVDG